VANGWPRDWLTRNFLPGSAGGLSVRAEAHPQAPLAARLPLEVFHDIRDVSIGAVDASGRRLAAPKTVCVARG
jgi:hypothetical protein